MNTITIPTKTRTLLETIVRQQQTLQAQLDVVILTIRDIMDVPADYVLRDLTIGFEAPKTTRVE